MLPLLSSLAKMGPRESRVEESRGEKEERKEGEERRKSGGQMEERRREIEAESSPSMLRCLNTQDCVKFRSWC